MGPESAPNGTAVGQLERVARIVAQIGFPIVVAGVLLYAILAEFAPSLRQLSGQLHEETLVLQALKTSLDTHQATMMEHRRLTEHP